jgi:hypothetical protein
MKQSELYGDILDSATDEVPSQDRQADITSTYTVRDAYYDWKSSLPDMSKNSKSFKQLGEIKDQKYREALELASVAEYDQSDLFEFLKLDWRRDWKDDIGNYEESPNSVADGIFVSAFAEALEAQEIRVPDMSDVSEFGYRNSSDLIVEGDAGDSLGKMMETGKVTVKGDSDLNLANKMKGGEIEVKGNAKEIWDIRGGRIVVQGSVENIYQVEGELTVKGDVERISGDEMLGRGGEIRVEGEIGSLNEEEIKGTEIYQNQDGSWEQVFP